MAFAEWSISNLFSHYCPDFRRPPFRISFGFPAGVRATSKHAGMCFSRSNSKDGHNEIYINPTLDDSVDIAATILHELVHAEDDNASKHGGRFKRLMVQLGFEGKMAQSQPGADLRELLDWYIEEHGPIPAAAIKDARHKPKQTTRMLKFACSDTGGCGSIARASASQLERVNALHATCPCCGEPLVDANGERFPYR